MSPRLNKKLKDISKSLTALNARKQKKVAIGTGHPGKNEGRDGDIVVRKISRKGMHLFVRYGQKWYSIPLEETVNSKYDEDRILVKPRNPVSSPFSGEVFKEGDYVVINNDVKIRNLANTDDGTIQAKSLKLDTGAASGEDKEFQIHYDAAHYIKFTVNSSGYLTITSVGTSLGTNTLKYNGSVFEFNGTNHRYIQMADDNDDDGNNLEVISGSAPAGVTDKTGGALILRAGKGTGDGNGGHIQFYIAKPGSTGTSQNSHSVAAYFNGETGDLRLYNDLLITAADKLYLDSGVGGGGDTYIVENATDNVRIVVGDDILLQLNEAGDNGNTITLGGSAGFTMVEPTYDVVIASATTAFNTDVDFRFGNKARLELTASQAVPVLGFIFPSTSGNFVLALEQASGGSGTVSDYKAYTYDEAAATTTDLLWAGGAEPTLTATGNKTDIISIFWDVETEIAYATITHNF